MTLTTQQFKRGGVKNKVFYSADKWSPGNSGDWESGNTKGYYIDLIREADRLLGNEPTPYENFTNSTIDELKQWSERVVEEVNTKS